VNHKYILKVIAFMYIPRDMIKYYT